MVKSNTADKLKSGLASLFRGIFCQNVTILWMTLDSTNRFFKFQGQTEAQPSPTEVKRAIFPSFFFFLTFEKAVLFIPLVLDLAGVMFTFEASKTVLRTQTSPTDQKI